MQMLGPHERPAQQRPVPVDQHSPGIPGRLRRLSDPRPSRPGPRQRVLGEFLTLLPRGTERIDFDIDPRYDYARLRVQADQVEQPGARFDIGAGMA